jgi:hypothetical protein
VGTLPGWTNLETISALVVAGNRPRLTYQVVLEMYELGRGVTEGTGKEVTMDRHKTILAG